MYYVTAKQFRHPKQLSWEDVINDNVPLNVFTDEESLATATVTRKYETIDRNLADKISVRGMIEWLEGFAERHKGLYEQDRETLYRTFRIPKKTGGFRRIDAPVPELQNALRELSQFITEGCGVLYHTSAFAYVKGRCIVDCLKKHQKNESKWFLKTDFSGFFPNTTLDFTMKMLKMVFPLCEVCRTERGYKALETAISLGFLNGGLPQGTVLSPTLTNCFMIPIDHTLFNTFAARHIVYTRYADDMHISAQEKFPMEEAIKIINETLTDFGAPWELKPEKTHYGSVKGKNWNLGLMLNANNDITVGYRNKKYFKAALCSFILDTKAGNYWQMEDVYHLRGQLSYYTMVEPDYFKRVIEQQNRKWDCDVEEMFRAYVSGAYRA